MLLYCDGTLRCFRSLGILFLALIGNRGVLSKGDDFLVFRGQTDRFPNPECSRREDSQCRRLRTCSQYFARCDSDECDSCVCDEESRTYVAAERRCVKDEEIFPRSVPKYSTFSISDTLKQNFFATDNSRLILSRYTGEPNERWMYTRSGQLMNMENLECIDATQRNKVAVRPCRANENGSQAWRCNSSAHASSLYQLVDQKPEYLGFQLDSFFVKKMDIALYIWKPYGKDSSQSICDIQDVYQGCYRYHSGAFVVDVPRERRGSDEEMRISAPIFVGNSQCTILWENSTFSLNDQSWTTLSGYPNYFTVSKNREKTREIILKVPHRAKVEWAGHLLKLEIQCKGASVSEQHCVLLKFEGWHYRHKPSSTVPMKKEMPIEKNYYKTSTIVLSVILLVLLLLFAFGAIVVCRRRNVNIFSCFEKAGFDSQGQPFCETENGPL